MYSMKMIEIIQILVKKSNIFLAEKSFPLFYHQNFIFKSDCRCKMCLSKLATSDSDNLFYKNHKFMYAELFDQHFFRLYVDFWADSPELFHLKSYEFFIADANNEELKNIDHPNRWWYIFDRINTIKLRKLYTDHRVIWDLPITNTKNIASEHLKKNFDRRCDKHFPNELKFKQSLENVLITVV